MASNQNNYTVYGLRVLSDIALPELTPSQRREDEADIFIRYDDLTEEWNLRSTDRSCYLFGERQVYLHVPDTAVFRMSEGSEMAVSPKEGADPTQIRLFLLGTCMAIILMQRRLLPLHGSGVIIDGSVYAIVGDSGAGKSTLAAAFLERGYQLISDDVIAVVNTDGNPVVLPAYPQQKLWPESVQMLGLDASAYQTIYSTKYAVPVTSSGFCTEPLPLAGVFELEKTDLDKLEKRQVAGLERLHMLHRHTFRKSFISPLGLNEWHFSAIAGLAGKVDIYRLSRPKNGITVHQLVEEILQTAGSAVVS
ncbi:aldolase [Paenibacillus rhizovicinus]|uniref:Aldolase n=1 Tax=Paenibacillus rhizovicinus TaxID=2704463 RepID=A0A6C0NXA2_9BACL|nr:aldolase [Paenibacillus rhizovicinus]QHW30850.1 aldolase [Paenibacillus rhizovicinus]